MNLSMYEIKKLSLRKIIITGILILFIGITYNFLSSYLYYDTYILTGNKNKIEAVNGKQANEIRKKIENQFNGEVNDYTIMAMKQFLQKEELSVGHLSEDQKSLYMLKYRNLSSLINTDMRGFTFGYCRGWQKFIINFSNTFSIFIVIYLVVVLYKIFICDRENGMAEIVYSTKMSRKKSISTRIGIANSIAAISYGVFYFVNLLIHMILYGLDGYEVGIQSISIFADSNHSFSVGGLAILMFLGGILSVCTISMIICVCSCYGKNTFSVILSSFLIITAPIFFDFTDISPTFQKILELLPIYSLNVISQYNTVKLYNNSILPAILSTIVNSAIILISFWCIKRYFKRYSLKKAY